MAKQPSDEAFSSEFLKAFPAFKGELSPGDLATGKQWFRIWNRARKSLNAERLIRECLPGGSLCDPQQVADNIRRYLDQWPEADGTIVEGGAGSQPTQACPEGKVLVQFVGCGKHPGASEYRWEPAETAFVEAYVGGVRYRIDIGARGADDASRGIRVTTNVEHKSDSHCSNSTVLWVEQESAE